MGFLSSLKGLLGGGEGQGAAADAVEYKDYTITPAPERREGGWNTAGLIRKSFEDGVKEQRFIRVDTHSSRDDAIAFSVVKGRQIIDEQGDRLFQER